RQQNRAAANTTLPHSSGAAKAIGLVIPELDGRLQGHAFRVPVIDGSVTELIATLEKEVTVDEVNAAMKKYESE
ncbi:type I glyceraldehyde-3-phosphate dehydrogenase, partial [Lawsonibacter sp. DFI.5.51]|nr:type I glyceraldehyde-3-phosphate dehydrogenase [Lawsonibacter sp. DFI.5.51]